MRLADEPQSSKEMDENVIEETQKAPRSVEQSVNEGILEELRHHRVLLGKWKCVLQSYSLLKINTNKKKILLNSKVIYLMRSNATVVTVFNKQNKSI